MRRYQDVLCDKLESCLLMESFDMHARDAFRLGSQECQVSYMREMPSLHLKHGH